MKYLDLTEYYQRLENTSKRLEKTHILAQLLKEAPSSQLETIVLLIQGKVFPAYDERKIGFASKMAIKALEVATGLPKEKIIQKWKKIGDLGETAAELSEKKKQRTLFSQSLTTKKVFDNIKKLAELEGSGSSDQKIKLAAELIGNAQKQEAKYIIRTLLEDLRVGVKTGTLRDAIVWAFYPPVYPLFTKCPNCNKSMPKIDKCLNCQTTLEKTEIKPTEKTLEVEDLVELKNKNLKDYSAILTKDEKTAREIYNWLVGQVEHALELTNDYGLVASRCRAGGLEALTKFTLIPGTPIKVMLYPKAKDMEDALQQAGTPAAVEFKYDGFRIQCHRNGKQIKLFTRRLEEVTKQFPDVIEILKTHVKSHDYILDGEIVGIDPETKVHIPFQNISQRIKRKHNIHEVLKKVPVTLHIFDIMEYNGKNLLNEPFKERRNLIEKIIKPVKYKIYLAEQIITESLKESEKFYETSLQAGQEGVMVKKLDAPYKPGSRVGYGFKVKPVMEALDLVIVGATWGEGKRGKWLSSFDLACKNGDKLLTIGKVGTGVKEKAEFGLTFEHLTKLLKPLITKEDGKHVDVKPELIVELNFEEIQKSPTYTSGYALRFPRIIRLRPDKPLSEVNTLKSIERLFKEQKGKK